LGNTEHIHDMGMVVQAAESGGASEVLGKMNDGAQTILTPVNTATGVNLTVEKHMKLRPILESSEQKANVSGTHPKIF
jgi:hypothetical protein